MKRLLPVLAVLCILAAVFSILPKSEGKTNAIASLDELNGLKVGVQTGVNYDLYLAERCPDAEFVYFSEFPSLMPSLKQGKIAAFLSESVSYPVEKIENPTFEYISEPLASVDNYMAISKDKTGLTVLPLLNEFIEGFIADGTMEELYAYWFTDYDRDNSVVDRSGITGENGVLVFTAEASYEPVCFAGQDGELQGFDVDVIYRFCREYGYEPKIIPLEYDAMTAALASGKCTVAMGILSDEERSEEILFSNTYYSYDIIVIYDTGAAQQGVSWDSLVNSFTKTFIRDERWKMFLQGALTTLLIALPSVILGTALGLLLYLWCSHGKKAEQKVTDILCWLMSSTPTVVLLMVLYYIVFSRYIISSNSVAIIGFSLLFGCGFYERIVGGVKAVGSGQAEAARAQGFNEDQTFFRIILPQAAEHFMPAYEGDVISLIQETSVVGYITVMDLTKMSDLVRGRTYEAFFPLLATAAIYFLLIWIMTGLFRKISSCMNHQNRNKDKILKGITGK